jgi:dCTP deaminase
MILSDKDIKKYLKVGKIKISPKPDFQSQIGSCSVDMRLGYEFRVFENSRVPYIDPFNEKLSKDITKIVKVKTGQSFVLQPSDFVLATTIESFSLPDDLLARLEGRSSLGRLGIVVHSTASIFEPGWSGKIVMELGNLGRMPVALYPGMRICALTFETMSSPVQIPYNKKKDAKYINQNSPVASRISTEKNRI